MFAPEWFLALLLVTTVLALVGDRMSRRRLRKPLEVMAREHRMHFSADDRFRIADKVAAEFPIPGAADVRVRDLIYGLQEDRYRYVFCAEFTMGVVRTKKRLQRVASLFEPKERTGAGSEEILLVILAPEDLPLIEQYRYFMNQS